MAEEAAQAAAQANWDVESDTEATTEENGSCSDVVPSFGRRSLMSMVVLDSGRADRQASHPCRPDSMRLFDCGLVSPIDDTAQSIETASCSLRQQTRRKGKSGGGGRNYNAATVDDIISRRDNDKGERTDPKMMSGKSHAILQMKMLIQEKTKSLGYRWDIPPDPSRA